VLEDRNSWQKSGRARLNCSSFVDFLETCIPPETRMLLPNHKANACVVMALLASTLSSWAAFSHRLLPMTQQILKRVNLGSSCREISLNPHPLSWLTRDTADQMIVHPESFVPMYLFYHNGPRPFSSINPATFEFDYIQPRLTTSRSRKRSSVL
jgi:hypothetical protein